jgi:hypothetical protein
MRGKYTFDFKSEKFIKYQYYAKQKILEPEPDFSEPLA